MRNNISIAIFGGGNMGSAMAYAIYNDYPDTLHIYDRNEHKCSKLKEHGIKCFTTISNQQYDFVIIAVKPKQISACKDNITTLLKPNGCIITVAAGIPIEFYKKLFLHHDIIRAMPTIAAKYGQSATACFTKDATPSNIDMANNILSCIGTTTWLDNEQDMHLATAIAGSGIAYFFKIMQEQISIATAIGLPEAKAYALINQSLQGAAAMAQGESKDMQSLINMVASPNGVTEKAINTMACKNINALLEDTIKSAINRSIELGEK